MGNKNSHHEMNSQKKNLDYENLDCIVKECIRCNEFDGIRILIRDDEFLLMFLKFLNNDKRMTGDLFFRNSKLLLNMVKYSSRNFRLKSLAETFVQAAINSKIKSIMDSKESEEVIRHRLESYKQSFASSNAVDENFMIRTVLHALQKLMSSNEYNAWCQLIRVSQNYLFQALRDLVEMLPTAHVSEYLHNWDINNTRARSLNFVDLKYIRIVTENSYLYKFVGVFECLPVGISIAAVNKTLNGSDFPIIYVNEMYSKMSKYSREEVIGKDFLFLLSRKERKDEFEEVFEALHSARSIKTVVTSYNDSGQQFDHLIGLKPLCTRVQTDHSFVIGLHFDVSASDSALRSSKLLLQDIMTLLPKDTICD